jgi:DNA modification methylase
MGRLILKSRHRLLCGDSTKQEDVELVMGGEKADAMISDPPYGMNYSGTAVGSQAGMDESQRREVRKVVGDDRPFDPVAVIEVFGSPSEVLLWGGDWYIGRLPDGGSIVVWDKRASIAADSIPGCPFEILWSMKRRRREFIRHPWGGWNSKEKGDSERFHPTQKPIVCMSYPIQVATNETDLVIDPFLGSGTTLIAAEQLGRRCYGLELEPAYCDVIVQRFEALTGEKAVLADETPRQP